MVTMAQSAANGCNTHTHVDRTHSLTHLHQHSYNHVVRKASSAITEFGIEFIIYFLRYLREGEQTGVPGEKTTDSLPANRYHTLEEKIQRS